MIRTVCTGCSLLCDDVYVKIENGKITNIWNACLLGVEKIKSSFSKQRLFHPTLNGRKISMEEAIENAADVLLNSRKTLIYGFTNSSNEAIEKGVELAENLRGFFDTTSSLCHGYSLNLASREKLSNPSLEEVLDFSDHIIYWGANPAESHHRHASKFTVFPRGKNVPEGIESRVLTSVDVRQTKTMRISKHKLVIEYGRDVELIEAIMSELKGKSLSKGNIAGVPLKDFIGFINDLKNSNYVSIFYGLGVIGTNNPAQKLKKLFQLVKELNNQQIKCIALPMSGHYNMVGAYKVTLMKTGFPYAVDFSNNSPRHSENVNFISQLLKGKFDTMLVVGSDPLSSLPRKVAQKISKLRLIVLDHSPSLTASKSNITIPVAFTGIEAGGAAYRMDGKKVELTKIVDPPENIYSDEEVLIKIIENLK